MPNLAFVKYTKLFILLLFLSAILQSCSIEKRLYNKGFHVEELLSKQKRNFKAESNFSNLIASIDTLNSFCSSPKDSLINNNYDTLFFDTKFELCYVKNITKSKIYFYNSLKKYTVNSIKKSKLLKIGLYNPNNFKDESKPKTIDTIIMLNNDTILTTQIKNFEFNHYITQQNKEYKYPTIFKENIEQINYADGKQVTFDYYNTNNNIHKKMQIHRVLNILFTSSFVVFLVIAFNNVTRIYQFAPLFLISLFSLIIALLTLKRQSQYFYYRKNKNK